MNASANGRSLILLAAILWGTTGTAQALAPAGATPIVVGVLRQLIGGGGLLLILLWRGDWRREGNWPPGATLVAAGAIAGYQLSFFAGVARTGVALGTIVAVGSAPLLAGLLTFVFDKEVPSKRWWLGTLLSIGGGILLILTRGNVQVDVGGILLALTAGLAYASFTLANKRILQHQPPQLVTAVVFTLGALVLLPFLFRAELVWLWRPQGMLVALHLGLITTALAYTLFLRGLVMTTAPTAVTLSLAEPLTAALLGIFLLGERLPPLAFVGIGLLLAGLLWMTLPPSWLPWRSLP